MSNLYFPPHPIVDPTAPVLPRWRVPAWVHQQQYNFIWENLPIIAEPDSIPQPLSGPNPKRRRLNSPVFHPASHQFCHSCDPFQRIIKVEDPEGRFLY
jgi:hypothetical protein